MISLKHLKGIHLDHHKNTAGFTIVPMPVPEKVYIPMVQHIGAPNVPVVSPGDRVKVGQLIGDSEAPVCAPVHSSVSGEVVAIETFMTQMGRNDVNVVIETDGKQELADTVVPPVVTNKEEFLKAVRASGLVGLGGAAFPTHIKYNPRNPEEVDTLIINGAECEPYITVDHMTMLAHAREIVDGTLNTLKYLSIKKGIIAIEGNKPDAISLFKDLTKDIPEIEVFELRLVYPQGAERVIIFETTGRHLIAGKLPADIGVLVSNVNSILKLQQYLETGMPLVTKSLTVDGNLIVHPQNVEVPIGTKIRDVIEFCGGTKRDPKKILFGGPMMGRAMPSDDLAILKGNNAILVFDEAFSTMNPETACINCGRCVRGCPMNLMPTTLAKAWDRKDLEALKAYDALTCMECGSCSYSCPARIQLSYKIKLAKDLVMQDLRKQVEQAKAQAEGGKNA